MSKHLRRWPFICLWLIILNVTASNHIPGTLFLSLLILCRDLINFKRFDLLRPAFFPFWIFTYRAKGRWFETRYKHRSSLGDGPSSIKIQYVELPRKGVKEQLLLSITIIQNTEPVHPSSWWPDVGCDAALLQDEDVISAHPIVQAFNVAVDVPRCTTILCECFLKVCGTKRRVINSYFCRGVKVEAAPLNWCSQWKNMSCELDCKVCINQAWQLKPLTDLRTHEKLNLFVFHPSVSLSLLVCVFVRVHYSSRNFFNFSQRVCSI